MFSVQATSAPVQVVVCLLNSPNPSDEQHEPPKQIVFPQRRHKQGLFGTVLQQGHSRDKESFNNAEYDSGREMGSTGL